ncbi:fibrous sheath CABYR-binding protein-like isoform X2 [Palaemon carinicauda]|uniref:fibrous sheath CABYR-binding protein-like isoform X2 n=1 Tax=Palaemon carinicauda TaxID=392227 RepID=UPI0035B5AC25
MAALKTLLFLVSCAIAVSAFPQATDRDDGGFFNPFFSLFPSLFNRRRIFGGNSTSNATTDFPFSFFGGGANPSEGDLNTNSTHEVMMKDGHKVEVNRTTGGDKDGGFFFTRVVMSIVPDEGAEGGSANDGSEVPAFPGASPSEDPSINQEVTSPPLVRRKRRSFRNYLNSLRRRKVKAKSMRRCHNSEESAENVLDDRASVLNAPAPLPRVPNPPTLEGDTNVNYVGNVPVLRDDPDVEIFDINLMRAAEEAFRSRNSPPLVAGPVMSQPIASGPVRSQPIMAEPLRSQPIMAEPLRSQPIMAEPLRSQPIMAEPLRSQPIMAEPLRSQPIMAEPLRSLRYQPAEDEPLQSQPIMAESLRSLRTQPAADEPLRSLRSQDIEAKPLRSQSISAEPLRSLRSEPSVDEPLSSQPINAGPLRPLRSHTAVEELRESQLISSEPLKSLSSQPTKSEPSRSLRSQPVLAKPLESRPDLTELLEPRPSRQQALRALPYEVQASKAPPLQTQDSSLLFKKFLRLL